MEGFILLGIAIILYILGNIGKKTDYFLYILSGILFIAAAGFGLLTPYQDVEIGTNTIYTYTTIDNQTQVLSKTETSIYSDTQYFHGLALIELFLGLYLILISSVEMKRDDRNEKIPHGYSK